MSELRKEFIDEDGDKLVIKKYKSGDLFMRVYNNNKINTVKILPHQFKDLYRAIKKATKEDTIS
ncbi:hypothetical protein CN376_22985 [Bacillus cereus]|uniref:hypothetical protein n=1 Tax=Bacillus cereus TaxID=1396 RepID=UPI000BF69CE4|nr:hypothetical protein [Bacillus cereus]PEZ87948.1 hypothetical protein CN376_22985 [Bacillus cereus]PFR12600.1 hypothetical protein COK30_13710 [Bacillus cereus]